MCQCVPRLFLCNHKSKAHSLSYPPRLPSPPCSSIRQRNLKRAAHPVREQSNARWHTCTGRRRSFKVTLAECYACTARGDAHAPQAVLLCARTSACPLCAPAAPALPPAPLVQHWSRQWHSLAPAASVLPVPTSAPSRGPRQRALVPAAAEPLCPRRVSSRVPDMRTPALVVCVLELSGDENAVPLGGDVSRNLGAKT